MYLRSKFMTLSGALVVLALLALGAYGGHSAAASQATETATATATATVGATQTATVGATETMPATGTATGTATTAATTVPPTSPPGQATAAATGTATRRPQTGATATLQFPLCTPTSTTGGSVGAVEATEVATDTVGAVTATTIAGTPEATPNPGFLGVVLQQVGNCGAQVTALASGSPAGRVGLRANDVIVAIDGEAITGVFDLRDRLDEHEGGDQVTLVVQRGNREVTLTVTLGNGLGM